MLATPAGALAEQREEVLEAVVVGGGGGHRQLGLELGVAENVNCRTTPLVERPAGARVRKPSSSQVLPSSIGVGRELTPLRRRVKRAPSQPKPLRHQLFTSPKPSR